VVFDAALVALLLQAPVQWRADPGCSAGDRMDAALAGLGATAPDGLVVDVTRGDDTWIARISTPIDRTIADPDCDTLARAVALVVAVNTVPIEAAQSQAIRAVLVPETMTQPTTTPPALTDERPITPTPPRGTTPPRRSVGGAWLLGAGIEAGRFPRVLGTITTAGAIRIGAARIELGAIVALPRELPHPAQSSVRARVQSFAGNLRGCWVLGGARLEAPICAGAEAGVVLASGLGLSDGGSAQSPWAAALVGPRLGWNVRAGRVTFMPWIGVEALVSVVRPRFVVNDLPGNLARAGAASARVLGGIEVKFAERGSRSRGASGATRAASRERKFDEARRTRR
jgi:hypothetical protein